MKSIIINSINYILPDRYLLLFSKFNSELLVIKEMGIYKFTIYIFFISLFFLILFFKSEKTKALKEIINYFSKHFLFIIIILSLSLFLNHFSYKAFIENQNIFYTPTVERIIYSSFSYLLLFFLTNLLFYFFTFNLTKNNKISLIITALWIFSALHISNLYPSLLRDYVKASLFYFNFIFLIYFLKNKINDNNLIIIYWWLFGLCVSILLKADLKLIFPIFFYILVLNLDLNFKKKFLIIFGVLLISINFIYLTSSFIESRNFQRFGASLSSELFNFNNNYSIGPFEDGLFFYKSCAFYQCNLIKTFLLTSFYQFDFVMFKFVKVFLEIIILPFKYTLIFEKSNIIHNILIYKSILFNIIFNLKYFYYLILVFVCIFSLIKKNIYILNLIIIYSYFSYVYSLEYFARHYFYLEGISLIIMYLSVKKFIKITYSLKSNEKK